MGNPAEQTANRAPRWKAYALAVLVSVATLYLRIAMTLWTGDRPVLIIFVIPIILSAYVGGLGPGLLATAVVAVSADYFLIRPVHSFAFEYPIDVMQWVILIVAGVLISMLNEELHRARRGWQSDAIHGEHSPTERKVQGGFAFALACLGLIGVVSYLSVTQLREDAAWIEHSHEVAASLDLLLSTATDTETGARGYAITGDEGYLEPYRAALAASDAEMRRVRALVVDNAAQERRLMALGPLVSERLIEAGKVIDQRRTQGFEGAQRQILTGKGKKLTDQIRSLVAEMKTDEANLLKQRDLRAERSTVITQTVIIAGGVIAFVFVGLAMFVIRRDLGKRRRAEEALQQAKDHLETSVLERTAELAETNASLRSREHRFRALLEHSSDGISLIDQHNNILYLSPSTTAVEGYCAEELVGRSGIENTHPDDVPLVHDTVARLMANPGKPIPVQWRRRHKNGQWLWLEGVATNLIGDPAVGGIVTNYRDITERKQAEAKLQAQLGQINLLNQITRAIGERQDLHGIFQVVIQSLEDQLSIDFSCVSLYDPTASVLTVASVGVRSAELAVEMAMSERASIPIDENGLSRCVRGQLVYEPDISAVRFPFPERLARGGLRSMVVAPLLVESKVFGVLVAARRQPRSFSSSECEFLRQLSEHVALAAHQAQLYSALQQAYDDLRQTQQTVMQQERLRALGQMASGIAHDINNAISPVALYTESLLENEPNLSDRARDHLQTIARSIDDVAATVARMREFYRQRETQLVLTPVALNVLAQQVVHLTRARWSDMPQQRGLVIELVTELAPELPAVMGVESEIREALTNLIFNAVDSMPEGGKLTLRTTVREDANGWDKSPAPPRVHVEVSDTGVGMDEDTRRRCLEPFFTTKGERGTGLGLAMVYGTVQRHSADIEIESAVGKGTTVRLSFSTPAIAATEMVQETAPIRVLSRLRILVVDDDPLLIKSLRDALEMDGHHVVTTNGGQAGIDAFRSAQESNQPFAAVITDLGMPYVDGRKVARTVKGMSASTPVILLTGWGQRLVAEGDVPPHVDRVLNKPPKLRDLREALAQCCRTSVSAERLAAQAPEPSSTVMTRVH